MKPVRVLIIDDSATMRRIIGFALASNPAIQVVGEAPDPTEAFKMVDSLDPDVITLDIEMPKMNGIDFLRRVMKHRPRPVIMVSTLTVNGAAVTIEALALGAFDCVAKPSLKDDRSFEDLIEKVIAAGAVRNRSSAALGRPAPAREPAAPSVMPAPSTAAGPLERLIAIGASTGGVEALIAVLSEFPMDCPPTVVTQHMPANFTRSFAERLDRLCRPTVQEAEDRRPLQRGNIYIAPGGGRHMEVVRGGGGLETRLREGETVSGHRPSVDVLMNSVAAAAGRDCVGIILTGMGRDGAQGLLKMRQNGARTIGQDEMSSLIYGMPRVAHEVGAVQKQLPLSRIAREIFTGARSTKEGTVSCHS
jgi:two-component system, chemotaxis family, protein-glutamate methylesterase/glutaminase